VKSAGTGGRVGFKDQVPEGGEGRLGGENIGLLLLLTFDGMEGRVHTGCG